MTSKSASPDGAGAPEYLIVSGSGRPESIDAYLYGPAGQSGRAITLAGSNGRFVTLVTSGAAPFYPGQADRIRSGMYGVVECSDFPTAGEALRSTASLLGIEMIGQYR